MVGHGTPQFVNRSLAPPPLFCARPTSRTSRDARTRSGPSPAASARRTRYAARVLRASVHPLGVQRDPTTHEGAV